MGSSRAQRSSACPDFPQHRGRVRAGDRLQGGAAPRGVAAVPDVRARPICGPSFRDSESRRPTAYWLPDWALFMALKGRYGGAAFREWPDEFRLRRAGRPCARRAGAGRRGRLARLPAVPLLPPVGSRPRGGPRARHPDPGRHPDLRLPRQRRRLVAPARSSSWTRRATRSRVAGVPPDYFSETGQLWGNPLYRWDVLERDGFHWWVERVRANLRLTELLRLDHFRGFAGYWAVAAGEETAIGGAWERGPGRKLFDALSAELGAARPRGRGPGRDHTRREGARRRRSACRG